MKADRYKIGNALHSIHFDLVIDTAYTGQRNYFCFDNYEYYIDVSEQNKLLTDTKRMDEGLREAFEWYQKNESQVEKMPYLNFIDKNMQGMRKERKYHVA